MSWRARAELLQVVFSCIGPLLEFPTVAGFIYVIWSFPSCLASFVYETEHFNGVAELLEILGRFVDV